MTNDTKSKRGKTQTSGDGTIEDLAAGLGGTTTNLAGSPDDRRTRSLSGSPDDR